MLISDFTDMRKISDETKISIRTKFISDHNVTVVPFLFMKNVRDTLCISICLGHVRSKFRPLQMHQKYKL